MKLDVISYDSDQNTISLEMDEEAKQWVLDRGFNAILTDAIKNFDVNDLPAKIEEKDQPT